MLRLLLLRLLLLLLLLLLLAATTTTHGRPKRRVSLNPFGLAPLLARRLLPLLARLPAAARASSPSRRQQLRLDVRHYTCGR